MGLSPNPSHVEFAENCEFYNLHDYLNFYFLMGYVSITKKQVCEFDGLGFENKSVNFLITVFDNCL
jgi:hypothetical protein